MKDLNYKKKYLKYKLKYINKKGGADFLSGLLKDVSKTNSRTIKIAGLFPPHSSGIHLYNIGFKQIIILTEAHQTDYHVNTNQISAYDFIYLYQTEFNAQVFTEMPDNFALSFPDNPNSPATSINIHKMYQKYAPDQAIMFPVPKHITDILKNIDSRDEKLNTILEDFSMQYKVKYDSIVERIIQFYKLESNPGIFVIATNINAIITHYSDQYLDNNIDVKTSYYTHFDLDFWKKISLIINFTAESVITEIRQDLINKEYIIDTINDLKEQLLQETFSNQDIIRIRFFCRQILSKFVEITYINHFLFNENNHHLILIGYDHYDFIKGYLVSTFQIPEVNEIEIKYNKYH